MTLDRAVANLMEFTQCSLSEALGTATANPAGVLGDTSRGIVEVGARADLTLFNPDLTVHTTLVGGRVVYGGSR